MHTRFPLTDPATNPEHLQQLEEWLRSYKPEELFDENGRFLPELADLAPKGKGVWALIHMPMAAFCFTIFTCLIFVIME